MDSAQQPDNREYQGWPRVYAAVLAVTAAVIIALAIFSDIFS